MLRRIFLTPFLLITLTLLLAHSQPAQAQLGIAGGYNANSFKDINLTSIPPLSLDFDQGSGYHIGLFYQINLAIVAIQPGIFFSKVNGIESDIFGNKTQIEMEMIEVPVDVRIRLPLPVVKPYILAAPVLLFPSSKFENIDTLLENQSWRGDVGLGVEIKLGGLHLYPEARYGFGLSRMFIPEFAVDDDGQEIPATITGGGEMSGVMIRLGIAF